MYGIHTACLTEQLPNSGNLPTLVELFLSLLYFPPPAPSFHPRLQARAWKSRTEGPTVPAGAPGAQLRLYPGPLKPTERDRGASYLIAY